MKFEFNCEGCQKQYALPYERVQGRVLKVRCKQCQNLMVVRDPQRVAPVSAPIEEPQTMGAQTLFSLQAIPSREEEEARLSAHQAVAPPPPPPLPSAEPPSTSPSSDQSSGASQGAEAATGAEELTTESTAQLSKRYRSEHSVKVEVPKPVDEWAQEVAAELDKPITREIKIDQLQGLRSGVDFRPAHVRYMPHLLGAALLLGLGALFAPHLTEQGAPPAPPPPAVRELSVTLTDEARAQSAKPKEGVSEGTSQADASLLELKGDPKAEPKAELSQAAEAKPKGAPAPSAQAQLKRAQVEAEKGSRATPKKKRSIKAKRRHAKRAKGLPQATIRQIVQQNAGGLSYCYQKVQKKSSIGSVKTRLYFTIQPTGRTDARSIRLSGQHKGGKLERCISMAVQRWRFPSAEGSSEVRYPLNFTAGF